MASVLLASALLLATSPSSPRRKGFCQLLWRQRSRARCRVPIPLGQVPMGRYYVAAVHEDRVGRKSALTVNVTYVEVQQVGAEQQRHRALGAP